MFLKTHRVRKDGKEHVYYSLCESLRVNRSRVTQRTVLHLGELNTRQLDRWQHRRLRRSTRMGNATSYGCSRIRKVARRRAMTSPKWCFPVCWCAGRVASAIAG